MISGAVRIMCFQYMLVILVFCPNPATTYGSCSDVIHNSNCVRLSLALMLLFLDALSLSLSVLFVFYLSVIKQKANVHWMPNIPNIQTTYINLIYKFFLLSFCNQVSLSHSLDISVLLWCIECVILSLLSHSIKLCVFRYKYIDDEFFP